MNTHCRVFYYEITSLAPKPPRTVRIFRPCVHSCPKCFGYEFYCPSLPGGLSFNAGGAKECSPARKGLLPNLSGERNPLLREEGVAAP